MISTTGSDSSSSSSRTLWSGIWASSAGVAAITILGSGGSIAEAVDNHSPALKTKRGMRIVFRRTKSSRGGMNTVPFCAPFRSPSSDAGRATRGEESNLCFGESMAGGS